MEDIKSQFGIKQIVEDENFKKFARSTLKRIQSDWDIVIAVDGEEGSGKSTLAMLLGMLLDPKFDLIKNIAYLPSHEEIEMKFKGLGKRQTFVIDEAIKAMYKMRFMDKMQTRINEMYATERWQNKVTILCIPRFTDLNEFFRNHRVKIWIHVLDRGLAVAFTKDDINIFNPDPWHLKLNEKLVKSSVRRRKFIEMGQADKLRIYNASKNFWFGFTFPKLPEKYEDAYKELKRKYREIPIKKDRIETQRRIINLYELQTLSQRDIARALELSESYVSEVISNHRNL